jgi:hypothetical protein
MEVYVEYMYEHGLLTTMDVISHIPTYRYQGIKGAYDIDSRYF